MTTVDASKAVFRIENLTINFPAKRQSVPSPLQGLNLTIQENKITTILGQSGCGKSTLLNALGGFVMGEDSGGVLYRQRYLNAPLEEIVMIFQENNLYPWLSVAGNVNFGLRFRNQDKKDVKATVRRMLDSVGLSEAADAYPHQLSGGMRQRTAIAGR
jgi:ABC-type nitrate/sulfonate/bicarbonate transport system ATPase subunit